MVLHIYILFYIYKYLIVKTITLYHIV